MKSIYLIKNLALCAIFTGVFAVGPGNISLRAQEPVAVEEQEPYAPIVDEVLDQIEKALDLSEKEKDPWAVPAEAVELQEVQIDPLLPAPAEIPQTRVIPLLYAEASTLIEALNDMKSDDGTVAYNEEDRALVLTDRPARLKAMEAFVMEADIPLETETFRLENIYAEDIVALIEEALTDDIGQVQVDGETDSLVVTDTPSQIARIAELIGEADRFGKDILIESHVLQIILNDQHTEGVDWEAIVSTYQVLAFPGFDAGRGAALSLGTVSADDYVILLEALDTVGVVRTVSKSALTTASGEERDVDILLSELRISDGKDIGSDISLHQDDGDLSAGGAKERGVRFKLAPKMRRGRPLLVSIEPRFLSGVLAQGGPEPQKASIPVRDGATIVIGSLFKDVAVDSSWKIPLLGDLPLLGFVFRNEGEELRKTEVITFLTFKAVDKKDHGAP